MEFGWEIKKKKQNQTTFNCNLLQNKTFQLVEPIMGHVSWVCLMTKWMRPLPGRSLPAVMQPIQGGELSGSHLVTAYMVMCTLVRSLVLRWELGTWGTWMAVLAAAATQGNTTKHSFLVWECPNTLHWQCQKNVFHTDIYQNFLFLEKL